MSLKSGQLLVAPTGEGNTAKNEQLIVAPTTSEENDVVGTSTTPVVVQKEKTREYRDIKQEVSYYVRKSAHFIIYLIGGILLFNFVSTFTENNKKRILLAILFVCLYAISDEIHQYFISDRSAEIADVALDTFGAFLRYFYKYFFEKNNKKSIDLNFY
ncbi:MAG: VanZ family protein [Clostridia bacterium]|nr:VanZ family protein [Clostridia bacterium]